MLLTSRLGRAFFANSSMRSGMNAIGEPKLEIVNGPENDMEAIVVFHS